MHVERTSGLGGLGDRLHGAGAVVGVDLVQPAVGIELVARSEAIVALAGFVGDRAAEGGIGMPHAQAARFQRQRQSPLTGLEVVAQAALIVDVGGGAEPLLDAAGCIPHRGRAPEEPAVRAVHGAAPAVLDRVWLTGGKTVRPGSEGAVVVVGVDHPAPAVAGNLGN